MTQTNPARPLEGRIALVTGATRGIGRAVAIGLAEAGAHVVAAGRTQGALESLDDELLAKGLERATLVPLDLTKPEDVDPLGGVIHERWGRLDILIAAAGMLGVMTPMAQLDLRIWQQVMTVNLTANYRLIRSMDPLLRRAEAGRAVFLTSGMGSNPRAFAAAYGVSKAGLAAMAKIYADEMTHTQVRVAVVNPGPMRTRMRAQAFPGEDPQTLPAPEEIVPLILEQLVPGSDPTGDVVNFADWKAQQPS